MKHETQAAQLLAALKCPDTRSEATQKILSIARRCDELEPAKNLRQDLIDELSAYAEKGRPLGGFLTSVVENDLFGAFAKADEYCSKNMFEIVKFIYLKLPVSCHGSPSRVTAHLKSFL